MDVDLAPVGRRGLSLSPLLVVQLDQTVPEGKAVSVCDHSISELEDAVPGWKNIVQIHHIWPFMPPFLRLLATLALRLVKFVALMPPLPLSLVIPEPTVQTLDRLSTKADISRLQHRVTTNKATHTGKDIIQVPACGNQLFDRLLSKIKRSHVPGKRVFGPGEVGEAVLAHFLV